MRVAVLVAVLVGAATAAVAARGAGDAAVTCFGKRATIVGKARADTIAGTAKADVIATLGGADVVDGRGGADLICTGPGDDIVAAGPGADRVDGGAGFDTCRAAERIAACEETRPRLPQGRVAAGEYVTDDFRPRFSIRLPAGWQSLRGDKPFQVLLARKPDPAGSTIYFDSLARKESVAETLARFARLSNAEVTPPVPASLGRASGQRIDLVSNDEVRLPGLFETYFLAPDDQARIYAVSVAGATVTVVVEAPDDQFAAFVQEAESVLGTLAFR